MFAMLRQFGCRMSPSLCIWPPETIFCKKICMPSLPLEVLIFLSERQRMRWEIIFSQMPPMHPSFWFCKFLLSFSRTLDDWPGCVSSPLTFSLQQVGEGAPRVTGLTALNAEDLAVPVGTLSISIIALPPARALILTGLCGGDAGGVRC